MKKAYINWSSGKDAAIALYHLQEEREYKIEKLVTTLNSEIKRVSMHGIRKELLLRQAESLGIPLHIISLNGNVSMANYNRVMQEETTTLVNEGFTHSIFGDIFLEDLRIYREQELEKAGLKAVFPLWKRDTYQLLKKLIEDGFKAVTVCVNAKLLDSTFCGRKIDMDFLNSLPAGIDPCGENGEFHTFVYDGPNFKNPVNFEVGEVVEKFYKPTKSKDDCFKKEEQTWDTGFWYCDLLPL